MSRKVECPDCGEYHTEITIPSWLEGPLNYMLMLAGPLDGVARIEAINEILSVPNDRHMGMPLMAHFILHCASGSAACSKSYGQGHESIVTWNDVVLKMLSADMTHFITNDASLRELALTHPNILAIDLSTLTETNDDEWYRAVTRAHFYSVCLDMAAHDEIGSKMYSVMAAALIGNNSLALTRAKFHITEETAIAKVGVATDEYRRVAVEALDAVISSFGTTRLN
jgi:hypothetical protein